MNEVSDSIFVTKKWSTVNYESNGNYNVGNEIVYKREVLTPDVSVVAAEGD